MADQVVLSVGTKRGLFQLWSDGKRGRWTLRGPFLKGWTVHHAMIDTRGSPRLHVAAANFAFASNAFSGPITAKGLKAAEKPPQAPELNPKARKFVKEYGLDATKRLWVITPGPEREKQVLYAGTAPAGLFRSEDRGKSWEPVESLNRHPTRKDWFPGAGGQSLHSIQIDPHDPKRMYVAISAAGSFRTDDGGKHWKPINDCVAEYVGAPEKTQVGTCVHKLLVHPTEPGRLFQQNHVGVYRSDDHGDSWKRIDDGLPHDFGFGLALHPRDPKTCYVIPLQPEQYAFRATAGSLNVFRLRNSGKGWRKLGKGLPQEGAYVSVLRQAMDSDRLDPCGIYFGTGGGQVFASADEGERWSTLAEYLPPVYSISVAVV